MADASLNRRMTVRLADRVAFAQIGIVGLDGQIELEVLRLFGLPEAVPALLCRTSTLLSECASSSHEPAHSRLRRSPAVPGIRAP